MQALFDPIDGMPPVVGRFLSFDHLLQQAADPADRVVEFGVGRGRGRFVNANGKMFRGQMNRTWGRLV